MATQESTGRPASEARWKLIDGERAERDDDRRDIEFPDEQAIDRAEHKADEQRACDKGKQRQARKRGVDHGDGHAGECEVRGHGEVDRARQDDGHLAERENNQDRRIVENGGEVGRPRETREAGRD
jgi:hypothetical protein